MGSGPTRGDLLLAHGRRDRWYGFAEEDCTGSSPASLSQQLPAIALQDGRAPPAALPRQIPASARPRRKATAPRGSESASSPPSAALRWDRRVCSYRKLGTTFSPNFRRKYGIQFSMS